MTTIDNVPFGPRLKALRAQRVLTQRELAERADLNQETITRLENLPAGADLPRPSTIRKLAKALGVKAADLVAPEVGEP